MAVDRVLTTRTDGPKVAVLGFLGTKASAQTLSPLRGRFDQVIATEPVAYGKAACPATRTASLLAALGYAPHVEENPEKALREGVRLA